MFIGHPDAGQRSAILYSIIVSCQRHGQDPLAYLRDILSRLPRMSNRDDHAPLLPFNWTPPQLPWAAGIFFFKQAYRSYTFGRQLDGGLKFL